jgi:hypothetical protein
MFPHRIMLGYVLSMHSNQIPIHLLFFASDKYPVTSEDGV